MTSPSLGLYQKLLIKYKAGDFLTVKNELGKLWALSPRWVRIALLEAYVCRSLREYVSEIGAINNLLRLADFAKAEERRLAADGLSLLGSAHAMLGNIPAAIKAYLRSAELEPKIGARLAEMSNAIFAAHYGADIGAEDFQSLFGEYRALLAKRRRFPRVLFSHGKIRLGILSVNFCVQPLAHFLRPLLRFLPRNKFCLYAYNAGIKRDKFTDDLQKYFDVWHEVGGNDDRQIAEKIRRDEIDILLETDGHSSGSRLSVLAYRPANVQVFGLGYMGSTGLTDTDYFVTDAQCLNTPESRNFLTEKPLLVENCHLCYDPITPMPAPSSLPPCVENGFVTFGCFNNFSKVTNVMLRTWAKILSDVPGSRLLLKHRIFDSAEGTKYTMRRFRSLGIDLDRVELQGLSRDYLSEYNRVDIALDTYPYTGALTTCEALYMGVPVVSCYGARPGSSFGRSLLKSVGLDELATANLRSYRAVAVNLALDCELLSLLRRNLRSMMQKSVLMDGKSYAAKVATILTKIYERDRERRE